METIRVPKPIAIVGAGGLGREIQWLISDINKANEQWQFIGFFDDHFSKQSIIHPNLFLGTIQDLQNWPHALAVVIAVGNSGVKRNIASQLTNPLIHFPILIHPRAVVGDIAVTLGAGSLITANAVITTHVKIGKHVLVGVNSTIGHDCVIHDFVSIMPLASISGNVVLEEAVYVGTGANIIQQKTIGKETIIGAGAVVINDMPEKSTAIGVPAKAFPSK